MGELTFAVDHNYPEPIVDALADYLGPRLIPVRHISEHLARVPDWRLIVELSLHEDGFAGLITCDHRMLSQPRELAALSQTKLTLIVTRSAGDDPIRATGVLLAHLDHICFHTTSDHPQIWDLKVRQKPAGHPRDYFERLADAQNTDANALYSSSKLTGAELRGEWGDDG